MEVQSYGDFSCGQSSPPFPPRNCTCDAFNFALLNELLKKSAQNNLFLEFKLGGHILG